MKCEICKKETEYFESHHIVPRSRGGSDDKSNLINLCINCHGKAHDVSFSNNRGGLIKEGVIKCKDNCKQGKNWLENNEKFYMDKMMDLYEKDEVKFGLILGLIENHKMDAYSIMKYVKGERVVIKTTITLN
tara:strand:+ start:124 stop:519 length:396 start_codon:yes stop_codon:yes gene_type:complete